MHLTITDSSATSIRQLAMRPPEILLADDDRDEHLMFIMAAEQASVAAEFQFAKNGTDVLRRLSRTQAVSDLPDLIVLDLRMPYLDGHRTLAALKNDPIYSGIHVAILTSSSSEEDRQRSQDLGADLFITKPSTFRAMVELAAELEQFALTANPQEPKEMETWSF